MRRRRRLRVGAVAAVLVVVGGLWWAVAARSGDGGALPEEDVLSSYRVVYSVTEGDAPARTEERLVLRPYWSKVVSERDGTVLGGSITNDDGLWLLLSDDQGWQLRDERRQRPPDDLRPIKALDAAVDDGRAERRGSDVVLGRTCTVIRTGGPLGGALKKPTAEEHADLCIDRTGVVLREEWSLGGAVARVMVATEFEPDVSVDAEDFRPTPDPGPQPSPEDAPGVIRVRDLGASDSVPVTVRGVEGYRADGPVVAVERNVGGFGIEVTYSQSFVKGVRLVVVEQGQARGSFEPRGTEVDLGDGVTGHLDLGLNSSSLTMRVGGGSYVRFRGDELEVLEAFGRDVAGRV